ncbi:MAG: hypothetical protein U0S48_21220 [Solirubrobacteraceae bacterium]
MRELTLLLDGGTFFEGARWRDGRWYVSDFYADRVIAVGSDGRAETVLEIAQPSGLGWLPDGTLLAVSMTEHRVWRRGPRGAPVLHADIAGFTRGEANDMLIDPLERAYVTNYGGADRGDAPSLGPPSRRSPPAARADGLGRRSPGSAARARDRARDRGPKRSPGGRIGCDHRATAPHPPEVWPCPS